MNLKENYERFFGRLETRKSEKIEKLSEEQKKKFMNLSRVLADKYPNAPMTIKEGYMWVGARKVEPANKFLNRTSLEIQEFVRSFSMSGKKGLL